MAFLSHINYKKKVFLLWTISGNLLDTEVLKVKSPNEKISICFLRRVA